MSSMLKKTAAGAAVTVAAGAAITVGGVFLASADAATATTGVNIRSGPGTSYSIVGGLARGQSITAIGAPHNGWVKVQFNGGTAYVSAQYLNLSDNEVNSTVPVMIYTHGNKIASASLNVRNGPSLDAKIIGYVSAGQSVSLTGKQSNGYAEMLYGGERAWVSSEYLISSMQGLPSSSGTRVATADLYIRTTDDSSFKIITTVPAGSTLKITGRTSNGYAQVIYDDAVRWVTAKYLSATSNSRPATPAGDANPDPVPNVVGSRYATTELLVRTSSGAGDRTVATVQRGDRVKITGQVANGRAQIVYRGVARWVTAKYLSTSSPRSDSDSSSSKTSAAGSSSPSGGVDPNYQGRSRNVANSVWDDLAMCESSGDWSINTGNGFYGGLQFTLQTWHGFGGTGMPNKATRDEQIRVAERVLAVQGWKAWPACSTKLGLR